MLRPATLLIASLCASPPWADGAPNVVADILPVHSLVAQVMGNIGTPSVLIGQGTDPHHFQLRPSQARLLTNSDVIFWVGEDLTPWLGESVQTLAPKISSIALADTNTEAEEDHHDHDPHAWLNPDEAMSWLDIIAETLIEYDSVNADIYQTNTERAKLSIRNTVGEVVALLDQQSLAPIIVAHDAYGHFTDHFGIAVAGAITDHEGQSPSAAKLKELRLTISDQGVLCAFHETNQNSDLILALTQNTVVSIGVLDPIGVSLQPGPDLYTDLISTIAHSISDCHRIRN